VSAEAQRVAVLIDCDNISYQLCGAIFEETSRHGTLGIKRAYGDWTSPYLAGWKAELPGHALQPIQQFAYTVGKNATDSALIIDAMDLLYSGNVDVFCIVSSDSDFTRLAMRLRESGKTVYGIGAKKTPVAFQNACDRFTYTEVLRGVTLPTRAEMSAVVVAKPAEQELSVPAIRSIITPAVKAKATDDGWAQLSVVGQYVVNQHPSFDSRNYGFEKLGLLVRKQPFLEVKDVPLGNGLNQVWVRLRSGGTPAKEAKKS
jgi:hypothetical protein